MTNLENQEKVRLDKWLWAARFFKTRVLASEAVEGGKVHVNGQRCKPSRFVHVGDALEITRGVEQYKVIVRGLNQQRRPAQEAALLYEETVQSREQRVAAAQMRKFTHAGQQAPAKRPDKKDRRTLIRFLGRGR